MRVNSPSVDSRGAGAGVGSARNAPELSMRVNSPCSGCFCGSGQSPAIGLSGSGELNIFVNSPGPDALGGCCVTGGATGARGKSGSAIGVGGAARNMAVKVLGPEVLDGADELGGTVGLCSSGLSEAAGGLGRNI